MGLKDLKKVRVPKLIEAKGNDRISCLTAYDYQTARMIDDCGIDIVLVGDSVEMVFAGAESTLSADIEQMIYHTKAVSRGLKRALLVSDMPFGSYQSSNEKAVDNAVRLMKEGAAEAVKLEGGKRMAERIQAITKADIPVMGHIGLTPQSVHKIGGYKRISDESVLIEDAEAVQEAGAFAVVLEMVEVSIAERIQRSLEIPVIGIGSGSGCDGQILVVNDVLGFSAEAAPSFAKQYSDLQGSIKKSVRSYIEDVRGGSF